MTAQTKTQGFAVYIDILRERLEAKPTHNSWSSEQDRLQLLCPRSWARLGKQKAELHKQKAGHTRLSRLLQ